MKPVLTAVTQQADGVSHAPEAVDPGPYRPEARSPRFDLSDPSLGSRIAKLLEKLKKRTVDRMEVFHYLYTTDGVWHCLDLDLSSTDRDLLDEAVRSFMETPRLPDEVCQASPPGMWVRMVHATVLRTRLLRCGGPRKRYPVAACSEVAIADDRER